MSIAHPCGRQQSDSYSQFHVLQGQTSTNRQAGVAHSKERCKMALPKADLVCSKHAACVEFVLE